MTIEKLEELLQEGEGFTIEYKECVKGLNGSVFETISSFSNRYGGYILLGIEEMNNRKGQVIGVNPKCIDDMKRNFINMLNNPKSISPSLFLNLEEIEYKGMTVLWVYVPVSSQLQFYNNKIYDRNDDSDLEISTSADLVANIARIKSSEYTERKIFEYATEDHFCVETIEKARKLAMNRDKHHPWKNMTDMELLRSAGLYEEDMMTGKKGFNLAAILLFGKPEVIQSCISGYKTDAIYRVNNVDRYDDRLIIEENLIESYELLMEFVAKHTDDKFFLVDNVSMSVRSVIAREIISNLLVHREFGSAFPAKLVIEKDKIYTENWNRARRVGKIELTEFTPYPKNPLLAKFFVNIGYADVLGSGVRNLYKFTKIYSGGEPLFQESDVFKLTVPLQDTINDMVENELTERQNKILAMIEKDISVQIEDIADSLNVSRATILREVQEIKKHRGIVYNKKTNQWKVTN